MEEHARKKREELDRVRKVEQRRWDEQGMKVRHHNLRATAGFLRTAAEPRLYYKPWELREEEEETIKRQIEEAEETIRRELNEFDAKRASKQQAPGELESQSPTSKQNDHIDADVDGGRRENGHRGETRNREPASGGPKSVDSSNASNSEARENDGDGDTETERPGGKQDVHEHDRGGEELEQGQEDDVIY